MNDVKEPQMDIKDPETESAAPSFDPNKKYTWAPQTQFVVNGAEFGVLLNGLRAILGSQIGQTVLLAERSSEIVESMLARAVINGDVKEQKEASK